LRELNALIERDNIHNDWENYRSALIASILAEIYRDRKKRTRAYTPADFMPKSTKRKQTKTVSPDEAIEYIKKNPQ